MGRLQLFRIHPLPTGFYALGLGHDKKLPGFGYDYADKVSTIKKICLH